MSGGQLEHLGQVAGWDDIKSYLLESDVPTTLTNDYEGKELLINLPPK